MGLFKKLKNKVSKAVKNVSSSVQKARETTANFVKDRTDKVEDRLDHLRDNIDRKFDNIRDVGSGAIDSIQDKFEGMDIGNMVDNYLDQVKGNIAARPKQPPLPDLTDVDNATQPDKLQGIVDKLTRPVDPDNAADVVTDSIINEIQQIIAAEGNDLWRERLDEYGVFADVIDYIDDQLDVQHQLMTNNVRVTPPETPDIPILEPNDARHQLIQPDEQTDLYTDGKELWDTVNQVVYTGAWHTRKTRNGLIALSGATYRKGDSQVLQLIPASEEVVILEQVDTTTNPLDITYESTPLTAYDANDGSVTLKVSDGTPPYKIQWTRTNELGISRPMNKFTNKLTIDRLPFGKYTAVVEDSYIETSNVDLREENDTEPSADKVKRLMDIILDKESRYNIDTQGWEFAVSDIPYVGKVHFVEMPIDVPVEDQTPAYTPTNPTQQDIKETQDLFDDYADKIYDEIMNRTGKAHRIKPYFKPNQPLTEIIRIKRPPRPPRFNIRDAFKERSRGPFGGGLIDKIRNRRKDLGGVFGNSKRRKNNPFTNGLSGRGGKSANRNKGIRNIFGRRR
jgi:hypothetical protein